MRMPPRRPGMPPEPFYDVSALSLRGGWLVRALPTILAFLAQNDRGRTNVQLPEQLPASLKSRTLLL